MSFIVSYNFNLTVVSQIEIIILLMMIITINKIIIPAIKQVIKQVDVENKTMQVELLEGLIDE